MNTVTATPDSTARAALQAIVEAHQNIDALLAAQRPLDPETRGTAVYLIHRIEDALTAHEMNIDLSAPLASTDIAHAWCHHDALKLLGPLLNRLASLGYELRFGALQ